MKDSVDTATPHGSTIDEEGAWRLIEVHTGRIHEIPPHGIVIGRDDGCDIVVPSQDVSRRHAVIRRAGTGYTVTDESANGTFVNDTRVQSVQTLARDDKLRIGTTVFRLEWQAPAVNLPGAATRRISSVTVAARPADSKAGSKGGNTQRPLRAIGPTDLAVLEVSAGPLSATRFTVLLKASSWYIVDLRSANGTFVDGYRVAGERVLPAGSVLTIGQVKMIFWPSSRPSYAARGTRRVVGMFQQLAKLIRNR
jgi:pSer/pThr/pTyr-binding forkhead associated (FHA) protein